MEENKPDESTFESDSKQPEKEDIKKTDNHLNEPKTRQKDEEDKKPSEPKKKPSRIVKPKKKSTNWGLVFGLIILVAAIVLVVVYWDNIFPGTIISQKIAFNSKNQILIQANIKPDLLKVYDSPDKNVQYTEGVDYIVLQQQGKVIVQRLEDGSIPPHAEVFLYYNEHEQPATTSQQQNQLATDKVIAEINGEKLTYDDLLTDYNMFFIITGYPEQYKQIITLKAYVNQSILERLLLQDAALRGITATPEEVAALENSFLQQTQQSKEDLISKLQKVGLTEDDLDKYFEKNLLIGKLVNETLQNITVTDEEAREFYDSNLQYFKVPEMVNASHILICYNGSVRCKSNLTKEEAFALAQEIRRMANNTSFEKLARKFSMGPSASKGGNLGFFGKGTMVKPFEDVAFNLSVGEISQPVETQFGYHIIKVYGRKNATVQSFEEVKDLIKESLKAQKQRTAFGNYTKQLEASADIKIYGIDNPKPQTSEESTNSSESDLSSGPTGNVINTPAQDFKTFKKTGNELCANDDGKPYILLFTTSWCPHCRWIRKAFDEVVKSYVKEGKIEAHHFELDTNDDLLTDEKESSIPQKFLDIYRDGNPKGYVPYFTFGCEYDRIGNGYEAEKDLDAEKSEFRQVINSLV